MAGKSSIVTVKFLGDASDLKKGTQEAEGALSGFGGKVASFGAGLVTGFGIDKVKDFMGDTIGLASDLNEATSKNAVVFGQGAGKIEQAAKDAAKTVGLSKVAYADLAGQVGVLGKSAGMAGDDLAGFTNTMAQRAADIGSFNNAATPDVIEAWGAAMRGEMEPMRKFGVLLDDASLRQEALNMGLVSSVKDALTPQQKALAANALIMKQTSDAAGDFARTSDGLANKTRIQNAQFDNLKTTIGTKLLPMKLALVSFIMEKVIPALVSIGTWINENVVPALKSLASFIQDQVLPVFQSIFGFLMDHKEILIGVAAAVGVLLVGAFVAWAVSAASAAAATIAATAPVIAIGVAIAALVAGIIYAYNHWGWFRDAVNAVKDAMLWYWNNVLKPVASFIVDKVVPAVVAIVGKLAEWGSKVLEIGGTIGGFIGDVVSWFTDLPGKIGTAISKVADFITAPFRSAFNAVAGLWNRTIGNLSFSVPDWVPGIGGHGFSFPKIPQLAAGGIVKATAGGRLVNVAEGGEDEAIIPLSKLRGQGGNVTVNVATNANPWQIAREVAWKMKVAF